MSVEFAPEVARLVILRTHAIVRAIGLDMHDAVVLMALVAEPEPLSVAALAEITTLSKRTLKRHLERLMNAGLIVKAPDHGSLWIRTPLLVAATELFYSTLWHRERAIAEFAEWLRLQRQGVK